MTVLGSSSSTGSVHFPYQPTNDSHYAIGTTGKDGLQCRLELTRISGDNYDGTVFVVNGNAQGTNAMPLTSDQQSMIIPGQGGLLDLAMICTAEMGEAGTVGSAVEFNYGAADVTNFQLGTDLAWTTLSQGKRPVNIICWTHADHRCRLGRSTEQPEFGFAARWILYRSEYLRERGWRKPGYHLLLPFVMPHKKSKCHETRLRFEKSVL
nr:hypothetical protein CFP56_09481 [Quercus suber]